LLEVRERPVTVVASYNGQEKQSALSELQDEWTFRYDVPVAPLWVVKLGAAFGGLVLLFFMVLVIITTLVRPVPCDSRFLVVVVLALGAALSASFLGGDAAAKGHLPIPFAKSHPIQFSAVGGVAVLLIVLLAGQQLYVTSSCGGAIDNRYSTLCAFTSGPKTGQTQDYAPMLALPIGTPCQDGQPVVSSGTVVPQPGKK